MLFPPAGIAGLVAGATTLLTAADLQRIENRTPAGALKEGVAKSKRSTLLQGAAITGVSLLSGPLTKLFPFLGKIGPAGVAFAFAAGTAASVVEKLEDAKAHAANAPYHKLFMSGAIGSTIEAAGLVAVGAGLLPMMPLPAKIALIGAGVGALAIGWPTSLGHGPLASAIH